MFIGEQPVKFIERGKKRIHQKPKTIEIRACEPWLEAELRKVHPRVVVALGATAARALLDNASAQGARNGAPVVYSACARQSDPVPTY